MTLTDKLLSKVGVTILIFLMLIPALWSHFGEWEGKFFPVVHNVNIEKETIAFIGNTPINEVYVSFYKTRDCEFVGLSWYSKDNQRLVINFPKSDDTDRTRPKGIQKNAGPWLIHDMLSIKDSYAIVRHKCHPLWKTKTKFFPSAVVEIKDDEN